MRTLLYLLALSACAQQPDASTPNRPEYQIAQPVSFSPDGSLAAIMAGRISYTGGVGGSSPEISGVGMLHVLRTADWGLMEIPPLPAAPSSFRRPVWAADCRRMIVACGGSVLEWDMNGRAWRDVNPIAFDSGNSLGCSGELKWSPDCRTLIGFDSLRRRIFVAGEMPISTKAKEQLRAIGPITRAGFAWSADKLSLWVAVADELKNRSYDAALPTLDNEGIYRVPLNGAAPVRLCGAGFVRRIIPSPDGKYLACEAGGMQSECLMFPSKVMLVATDSGKITDISKARPYASLNWSADSHRLAMDGLDGPTIYHVASNRQETLRGGVRPYWMTINPLSGEPTAISGRTVVVWKNRNWTPAWSLPDTAAAPAKP